VSGSGTRVAKTAARREAIVDAALALFATYGYRGTSIDAVAARVGVTDAGVLYHFGTKADLLLAVLAHHDARWAEMVLAARALGPAEELRRLSEWGAEMEKHTDLVALLVILSAEHLREHTPTNAYLRTRYKTVVDGYRDTFAAAVGAGLICEDVDARAEAVALAAFLDGIRLQWFFTDGAVSMADAVRRYMETTLSRLAREGVQA
jgi:AcrR family transcriptional regulator